MKIEDISKIYDFLGSIRITGFISLMAILAIIIWILVAPYKPDSGISKPFALILIAIFIASVSALYLDARSKTRYLEIANFIKQDLIISNFKQKAFTRIAFPANEAGNVKTAEDRIDILKNVIHEFPDQFSQVSLGDGSPGIAVIDTKAIAKIDSQINAKATRTSHLLVTIINSNPSKIVYVDSHCSDQTLQKIDGNGYLKGQSFFRSLTGRDSLQPIYDQHFNIIAFTLPRPVGPPGKTENLSNGTAKGTTYLLKYLIKLSANNIIYVNNDCDSQTIRKIDNQGYLIGQEFFKNLVGRNDLQPIYDYNWDIIAFTIPKKQ